MMETILFAEFMNALADLSLPVEVALAAVATFGYLIGRSNREKPIVKSECTTQQELQQTRVVAEDLQQAAESIRCALAQHDRTVQSLQRFLAWQQAARRPMEPAAVDQILDNVDSPAPFAAPKIESSLDSIALS